MFIFLHEAYGAVCAAGARGAAPHRSDGGGAELQLVLRQSLGQAALHGARLALLQPGRLQRLLPSGAPPVLVYVVGAVVGGLPLPPAAGGSLTVCRAGKLPSASWPPEGPEPAQSVT